MTEVCETFDQNNNKLRNAKKASTKLSPSVWKTHIQGRVINYLITFGFWADCKESIVCEEFEQRTDSIRVSSQKDFSVGSVQ